jgi:phosphotransferase system, enzyme I, PtsP
MRSSDRKGTELSMKDKGKKSGHLNLLCDIGDLTDLLISSLSIDNFLQRAVEMVARYLNTDVCSIYLYDEPTGELYLAATTGLNPEAVNKVRMKVGEGIVGHCFQTLRPVCEGKGSTSPHFKFFEEAHEDRFKSFLVVPIHRGAVKIGAIVVQHERADVFEEAEILALRAASSQLASSIENARLLMQMNPEAAPASPSQAVLPPNPVRAGVASEGYAYAPITVYRRNSPFSLAEAPQEDDTSTLEDFHRAIDATAEQLQALQAMFSKRLPESASLIFTTHFMMLKDESFVGKMVRLIEQGISPMNAVSQISGHYTTLFLSNPHEYVREKANDVEDLTIRILRNLKERDHAGLPSEQRRIVVADQLYPSDVLKLVANDVQGIILVGGGVTAHISILSRSLHIPLLLADQPELMNIPEDTPVLMDAYTGNIYIKPSLRIVKGFQTRERTRQMARQKSRRAGGVNKTRDGVLVQLMANINLLSEVPLALELKAQGVGLYRTEFPFLIRPTFPSETEQYLVYKKLFDEMKGQTVTVRTLDAGGEKVIAYLDMPPENNPELGMRSIRFSLDHREIFETQIRAILRAAADAPAARIMFPMISSLDEFLEARQIVRDCMVSLKAEGLAFNDKPAIGMMVELPSLVDIMDDLAKEADFFSIGTNDFIQYMLAVDRSNKRVSRYYAAHHPAVLRALAKVVAAAQHGGREIAVCGEMAHEVAHLPFLLGIGIRQLSVDPQFLPSLHESISRIRIPDARDYAKVLLSLPSIRDVQAAMADEAWKKKFGKN